MKNGRPLKDIDLEQARTLRAQGLTWRRVAQEVGCHRNTLLVLRQAEQVMQQQVTEKKCGGYCRRVLPIEEFSIDRSRRDGRNLKCRGCVSWRRKEIYSSPCVDCGGPRRSPTPGQCRRCYQMTALLKRTEFDMIWLIPNLIVEHKKQLLGDLIGNDRMRPVDKLMALVERVTSGNPRNITTQSQPQ